MHGEVEVAGLHDSGKARHHRSCPVCLSLSVAAPAPGPAAAPAPGPATTPALSVCLCLSLYVSHNFLNRKSLAFGLFCGIQFYDSWTGISKSWANLRKIKSSA